MSNAFDDLIGSRVQIEKEGHEFQCRSGVVISSGIGSCVDVFWPIFSVLLDGRTHPVTLKERADVCVMPANTKESN